MSIARTGGSGSAVAAGAVTYLDVTASRDYNSTTDKGKVLRPSPASSSFTITVQTTSGQAEADIFATSKTSTGTIQKFKLREMAKGV